MGLEQISRVWYCVSTMLKIIKENKNFTAQGNQVFFISLGCPRNLVDTEVMLGILLKSGYQAAQELTEADFIVINTCGFLDASRKESIDTIRASLNQRKKGAKVIATGCMVQTHSADIKEKCPEVDYMLGSGDVEKILSAVQSQSDGSCITSARSYLEAGEVPRTISTPKHYAYLKIAEGCRKRCSYCIIPDIKGPLKSKPLERIVHEFRILLKSGVKEVILIAQDLGDWGKDLGLRKGEGLLLLLKELLKEPGNYWLRMLYLYPDEITDDIIELMKSEPRICPYLDMPLQHINDTVLKSMRRMTSREEIIAIITKLRKEIPDISIRTSLIVGFPGETEEQFKELKEFLKKYPLENVGIFPFSPEPNSHAVTLPDHVDEATKQRRHKELAKVQQKALEKTLQKLVGKKMQVIVEGYHPDSNLLMRARHKGQCPEIDGQVIINDCRNVKAFGEWYEATITGVAGYDLIASI